MRRPLFRLAGGLAPSLAESHLRFGGIDWGRTKVFSEEITYAPSLWFNQKGREPKGTLSPGEREHTMRLVEQALQNFKEPEGETLVARVVRREEIHAGPHVERYPDLILELTTGGVYQPVLLPSKGHSGPLVTRLTQSEHLGRKGRSLPGCHTRQGILAVRGTGVTTPTIENADLHDVASIVCGLLGAKAGDWFESKPLTGLPTAVCGSTTVSRDDHSASPVIEPYTQDEEHIVAERLKRLGYLDD